VNWVTYPLYPPPLSREGEGLFERGADAPLRHPQRFLTGVKIVTRKGEGSLLKEGIFTPEKRCFCGGPVFAPLKHPVRLVPLQRRQRDKNSGFVYERVLGFSFSPNPPSKAVPLKFS